jgi:3-methyl-2-oxobutanoate hydroxymethyltransferase
MRRIQDFAKHKASGTKISMITCYDYTSAKIVAGTSADCILVGDSLAMTMHGFDSTLPATPELMAMHTAAVRRGAPEKFIVGDMPFLAHRGSMDRTLDAVSQIMRAGADSVKIEGLDGSEDVIHHLVKSGVPVMGHLGLTPQSVHQLSGYKVQATSDVGASKLREDAIKLQELGAFAIVLECVPADLAASVTQSLQIPTIGIGAGAGCDGQVLVFQDMLGLNTDFKPKFVRTYLSGSELIQEAVNRYDADVKSGDFPSEQEQY